MLQNLQIFAKFKNLQLGNLVDFEKCCKTRIFLQRSAPIQPKTSEILPNICRNFTEILPTDTDGGGRALSPSYARLFPDAFPTAPTDRSAGGESRLIFRKSSVQVAAERAWGTSGASRERSSLGKHYYRTSPSVDLCVMNS